jgi:hypothetical protein
MKANFKDEKEFESKPHLRDLLNLALPVKETINKTLSISSG